MVLFDVDLRNTKLANDQLINTRIKTNRYGRLGSGYRKDYVFYYAVLYSRQYECVKKYIK